MCALWGIDAGHGGRNIGAVASGIIEKNYTLDQALMLQEIMEAAGLETVLIRSDDITMSLQDRASAADRLGCSHVLSLHVNAAQDHSWGGALALVHPGNEKMFDAARGISAGFPKELRRLDGAHYADRDSWPDAHAVVSAYSQSVVLIEFGFATNAIDARALTDIKIRTLANLAIAAGALRV